MPPGGTSSATSIGKGTQQLAAKVRHDLVAVFVLPPSLPALEARLRARAQDTAPVVAGEWPSRPKR